MADFIDETIIMKNAEKIINFENNNNVQQIIHNIVDDGTQEEPFYICDLSDVIKKYLIWKKCMPRVTPFYAVKCNDSGVILQLLADLGTGFDCASKGEINKVLNLGVPAERIIFANPTKPKSHIIHAEKSNVKVMTFDSDFELHKIKYYYPDAELVLRIRCDAKVSQCPLGNKFGCDPKFEAPKLMKLARKLELNIVGISFHVGSGCADPPIYREAIQAARELFDYAKDLGFNCELLDIGGGFPGDKGKSIEKIANVVNKALDDFFSDIFVKVIAEPGRFFVASAYTLACNIHSKRNVIDKNDESINHVMYFVNDGVYGSFNCMLYDHQLVHPVPLNNAFGKKMKSSVWGPTCDALDRICEEIMLPELQIGDWMTFDNMGAYTIPVASPFNGFSLPTIKYCIALPSVKY